MIAEADKVNALESQVTQLAGQRNEATAQREAYEARCEAAEKRANELRNALETAMADTAGGVTSLPPVAQLLVLTEWARAQAFALYARIPRAMTFDGNSWNVCRTDDEIVLTCERNITEGLDATFGLGQLRSELARALAHQTAKAPGAAEQVAGLEAKIAAAETAHSARREVEYRFPVALGAGA